MPGPPLGTGQTNIQTDGQTDGQTTVRAVPVSPMGGLLKLVSY